MGLILSVKLVLVLIAFVIFMTLVMIAAYPISKIISESLCQLIDLILLGKRHPKAIPIFSKENLLPEWILKWKKIGKMQ